MHSRLIRAMVKPRLDQKINITRKEKGFYMAKNNKKNTPEVNAPEVNAPIAPVKTVAELMNETRVQFAKPATITAVTSDLAEYLQLYASELRDRARQLGKGCGGRILDETIASFFAVTGKGLSKSDLKQILIASACGRTDANGYCATFAKSDDPSAKLAGCPSRVIRFKQNGLYCVKPSI